MDEYIKKALEELNKQIPDDCEAEYKQVKKNNGVLLDGFIIRQIGNCIAPTFYLSDEERSRLSPEEFASQTAKHFNIEMERGIDFDIANFEDINWVKEHLLFEVVNRERNAGTNYASIPITPDLMIIFKVSVGLNASIKVTNDHLHLWDDISPEELLDNARNNAVVMDKATFRSIADVLIDMIADEYRDQYPDLSEVEFRARIKEEMFGNMDSMLYVLSTQQQSNAAMLYPDMLDSIREKLDDNLIILPSSIHEILIMKETDALSVGLDTVKNMVREVNRDVVMQDNASDFLSDEILLYDGELKQIDNLYYEREAI